jgi:hypothetical protein
MKEPNASQRRPANSNQIISVLKSVQNTASRGRLRLAKNDDVVIDLS